MARKRPSNALPPTVGPVPDPAGGSLFSGGGEMGALMRATDWSATRLGPVDTWPLSLRTMLGVVLGSRFPMLLWWGPDLLHLYNDAYRPILRDKHPASLASPAAEVWAEVWDLAGPMARGVQQGGPATWTEDLQLFINSGAMLEETYFTFSYSPVPDDDGRVGGLLNTVQETTVKVQGERQIRMLHELAAGAAQARSEADAYRLVTEMLAGYELDLPFVLVYVPDKRGEEALLAAACGWSQEEGPPRPATVSMDDEAGSRSWPLADALRTAGSVLVDDLSARFGELPVGRWGARPERAIVLPLGRGGKEPPYAFLVAGISPHRALDERYLGFFHAMAGQVGNVVTNALAYEAEARRAEALAEVDRAKTTFFSNVSHEFRTPLTLILGPIQDAVEQAGGSLTGEPLHAVHRSALRLLRLVNSLLEFARMESSRQEVTFVPTDLPLLTTELAGSFRSLVERVGLVLDVDCPPLGEAVYVDPIQWEKVVLNLLSNAFKYTFSGVIGVSLRQVDAHVELTVSDTGTGIPEAALPHVFERFHRVEGAVGRSFEGSGIGLSLVRELVHAHGGTVSVASVEGQGSSFRVSIPLGKAHLPAERVRDAHGAAMAVGAASYVIEASRWIGAGAEVGTEGDPRGDGLPPEAGASAPTRPRILVVDDNADMRAYLHRLLSPSYTVMLVNDGEEALAAALAEPPSLVLSDVMMPRMDGLALVAALRAADATRTVPIVLLSARAGEDALVGGLSSGADDYVVKPFSARELLSRVRTHLLLADLRRRAELAAEELARTRALLLERLRLKHEELEAFSYSVAHDLRAPLRAIDGFSKAVLEDFGHSLPEAAVGDLQRVCRAAGRMNQLIDDLLELSRIDNAAMFTQELSLSALVEEGIAVLRSREPARVVKVEVQPDVRAWGDVRLLRILVENLCANAWKFTGRVAAPAIAFGVDSAAGEPQYFLRDNGAGFDPSAVSRLFRPFSRLHSASDFPGTGVGLATVARVVARHGGRVWAEGAPGAGATFFWTLPALPRVVE